MPPAAHAHHVSVLAWLMAACVVARAGGVSPAPTTAPATRPAPATRSTIGPEVTLSGGAEKVTIPLARAGDHLVVRASINDQPPGWFLVDTGCTHTVLDKTWAADHHLPPVAQGDFGTTSRSVGVDVVLVQRCDVGGGRLTSSRMIVPTLDLAAIGTFLGVKLDGVLGNNVLGAQPFTIDYLAATLTTYSPSGFSPPGGAATELRLRHGYPEIRTTTGDDGEAWFQVDTGSSGGVDLFAPYVAFHPVPESRRHAFRSFSVGMGGLKEEYHTQLASLSVFGRTFADVSASRPAQGGPPGPGESWCAGRLGSDLLCDARVTLDYAGGRAWGEWLVDPMTQPAAAMRARLEAWCAQDLTGMTPLILAAKAGRVDVMKLLLDAGADPNTETRQSLSPLFAAARRLDTVRLILERGAKVNTQSSFGGHTAVENAAGNGRLDVVNALLAAGADPNLADLQGSTPLTLAAEADYPDVVRALLAAKADPNIKDKDGRTPLYFAAASGDVPAVKALIDAGAAVDGRAVGEQTPLMAAAGSGKVGTASVLLDLGAAVNAVASSGATPLMFAAKYGQPVVSRFLIDHGADLGRVMKDGKTARDVAEGASAYNVLQVLVFAAEDAAKAATPAPSPGPSTRP